LSRDFRGQYWGYSPSKKLADVTCTCGAVADPLWAAGRAAGDPQSRYPTQYYSPSLGHQLIPVVKQTLSTAASGRWSPSSDERGNLVVGSISLVNCNSPTKIALDLEELGEGGRPYSGDAR
jgi:hypothetical protein